MAKADKAKKAGGKKAAKKQAAPVEAAPWIGLPEFHLADFTTPQTWSVIAMFLPVVLVLVANHHGDGEARIVVRQFVESVQHGGAHGRAVVACLFRGEQRQLAAGEARVNALGLRLAARRPDLAQRRARLDALAQRLERAAGNLLARRKSRPDALAQHLAHLDPRGVLARGYSITRNAAGEIVRDAGSLPPVPKADGT